ncbi:MAG TPA: trehalose-phosphatase [bacterium]
MGDRRPAGRGRVILPHALRDWPRLRGRLVRARAVILCDYDGTLAPLKRTPLLARMPAGTRRALAALHRPPRVIAGVVSGRSLASLCRFVAVPGLLYVGNHGWEISGAGMRYTAPGARRIKPLLASLSSRLHEALRGIPGAWVEPKGVSLSVHWREVAPGRTRAFRRAVDGVLGPWKRRGRIRVTQGKRVVEVRPPERWDKGRSIEWVMRRLRAGSGVALCYLGDDSTDEHAFRSVNRLGGMSVFVGAAGSPTRARWRLDGPADVRRFLAGIRREFIRAGVLPDEVSP